MKNILVLLFPAGLGGHHLANILSTSDKYQHHVDLNRYLFQTEDAHYRSVNDNDLGNCPVILAPHFCNADDNLIKNLQAHNLVEFLLIHMPNKNELAWQRFNIINANGLTSFQIQNLLFIRHDLEKIYKPQFLSAIYGGTWNTIFSDDLFSEDIDKVLDDLETNLLIKFLDRPLARHIHIKWLANLHLSLKNRIHR